MTLSVDVCVIGGGLGGLATAVFLQQQGKKVVLLEQQPRPGGRVRSTQLDAETVLEHGPLGWLDKEPAVLDLCDLLGQTPIPAEPVQKERRLWKGGKIYALPKGPGSFLATPVMPLRSRLRLLMEPFIRRRPEDLGEESVAAFARRRFGAGVADNLFAAMVSGIYGGDAHRLSVQAAFPLMAGWERDRGSCVAGALPHMRRLKREVQSGKRRPTSRNLMTVEGGMAGLTDGMAHHLGENFRPGQDVDQLRRLDHKWLVLDSSGSTLVEASEVVAATPSAVTARLLREEAPPLQQVGAAQVVAPLAVVHFLLRQEDIGADIQSFGFLALRNQGLRALGVQYASSIFPGQTAKGLVQLRILMGGVHDQDLLNLQDPAIAAAAWEPLVEPLQIHGEAIHTEVTRLPHAIPQYDLGHLERRAEFEQVAAKLGGLHLGGDALHGVGVTAVLARAQATARALA